MSGKELATYEAMLQEDARGLRQEELILEVAEALARALRSSGLTKTELAQRLGKSKGFISQLLGGGNNLTLRTLSDVSGALGCKVQVHLKPERASSLCYIHDWNQRPARAAEAEALDSPPESRAEWDLAQLAG